MPRNDIEEARFRPRRGFAAVADQIAQDVDKTTTIYRRFDTLSARNILLFQAEIAVLEEEQREYDIEDANELNLINDQSDYEEFVKLASATDAKGELLHSKQKVRYDLAMKIRETLKDYHETLAIHRNLLNTPHPSRNTVKAMQTWFSPLEGDKTSGEKVSRLSGPSEKICNDYHDLVALRVPAEQDRLSEFIQNNLGIFFRTSNPENGTVYISERSVSRFVAVLSTILAATLLFGATISLYFVKNEKALLGMVGGWTILFASCVGLLTNARRDQLFGSTAAYAAVLVVFVSGNLGNSSPEGGGCICRQAPT